jgi:hypothetical protein
VAHEANRRPFTAEAWVRSLTSPCEICGRQTGSGTGFSPSTFVFLSQYYSTGVAHSFVYHRRYIIIAVINKTHPLYRSCSWEDSAHPGNVGILYVLRDTKIYDKAHKNQVMVNLIQMNPVRIVTKYFTKTSAAFYSVCTQESKWRENILKKNIIFIVAKCYFFCTV